MPQRKMQGISDIHCYKKMCSSRHPLCSKSSEDSYICSRQTRPTGSETLGSQAPQAGEPGSPRNPGVRRVRSSRAQCSELPPPP